MDNDKINATIINPELPASSDGLLAVSGNKVDSVQLANGRLAISNEGIITTVTQ